MTMIPIKKAVGVLVMMSLLALSTAPTRSTSSKPTAIRYRVIDIGTLPGHHVSQANGINNAGQIVGVSQTETNSEGFENPKAMRQRAVLWQNGKLIDLRTPAGFPYSYGSSINNKGEILGTFSPDLTGAHLTIVIWKNGKTQRINLPNQKSEGLTLFNDQDDIVGNDKPGGELSSPRAFLIHQGKLVVLSPLRSGDSAGATAVANAKSGQMPLIIGISGTTPIVWRDGKPQALPTPLYGQAQAINDAGVIVGECLSSRKGPAHPCFWRNGALHDVASTPTENGSAMAVNNHLQIVGFFLPAKSTPLRASLWEHGHQINLNDCIPPGSGWVLTQASGINDRGEIIGDGT